MEENKDNEKIVKNEAKTASAMNSSYRKSTTKTTEKNTVKRPDTKKSETVKFESQNPKRGESSKFETVNSKRSESPKFETVNSKSNEAPKFETVHTKSNDAPKFEVVNSKSNEAPKFEATNSRVIETSPASNMHQSPKVASSSSKNNSYKPVGEFNFEKKKKSFSFTKSIFLPFLSGILGTAVVVGVCFGIPTVKDKVVDFLNITSPSTYTADNNSSNNNSSTSDTPLISLEDYSATATSVAKTVRPSIVGITVEYSVNSIFYRNTYQTATVQGSGIIISEDGYILTNSHVVNATSSSTFYVLDEASKVTVYLADDETGYDATIIGTDDQTDLAIIKIEKDGLVAAKLGDSDSVQVGEFAMAIGNPLGMENSVSAGIISATNRKITSDGKTFTLIQTDAAINSGNSGGALVNSKGEVIGVNTLKVQGTGVEALGFAIPINSTKDITDQLIQYSKVKRPYIGITGIEVDEAMAKQYNLVVGVYVKNVEDFSSAQRADIRVGDVIIEVEGEKITNMDKINEIKNAHKVGDQLRVKVNRNGEEKEVTLTLQEQ